MAGFSPDDGVLTGCAMARGYPRAKLLLESGRRVVKAACTVRPSARQFLGMEELPVLP